MLTPQSNPKHNHHVASLTQDQRSVWQTLWLESVEKDGGVSAEALEASWGEMRFSASENKAEYGLHAMMAYDEAGQAIGLLHYVLHPVAGCVHPVCYLQDVYVRIENRRQGVGSALLNKLQAIADQQSWDRIYWFVDERNEDAKAFYEGRSVTVDFKLHFLPVRLMREQGIS